MDLRKLKTLIELVETSGIAELEIQEGEERVRITRSHGASAAPMTAAQPLMAVAAAPAAASIAAAAPAQVRLPAYTREVLPNGVVLVMSPRAGVPLESLPEEL